jgi:hypothetical protein
MSDEPRFGPQRVFALISGDAEGGVGQRILYYAFRLILGGIVGFMVVAMSTPSREHQGGEGFGFEFYLYGIIAGAAAAVILAVVPRLLHPKDWPTHKEFRRGAQEHDPDDPG